MTTHTYVNGTPDKAAGTRKHHTLPLSLYYKVFGALIFFTVLTVGISYMNLGSASVYVALFVAVIKAGLVIGFFMHLKYDDRLYSLVGVIVLFFVICFFGLTFSDIATRDSIQSDWSNHVLQEEIIDKSPQEGCSDPKSCYQIRQHNFMSQKGGH